MKNYYIADTHFAHPNVIRFDRRPFSSVKEMDEKLIENWNFMVEPTDTVYILGDWIFLKAVDPLYMEIGMCLNGQKILIAGNHDPKQFSKEQRCQLNIVEIAPVKEIVESDGSHVILSHYPMPFFRCDYKEDFYHFCGHIHTTREDAALETLIKSIVLSHEVSGDNFGNILNVGCMKPYISYSPQSFDYLKQIIKQRNEQFLLEKETKNVSNSR